MQTDVVQGLDEEKETDKAVVFVAFEVVKVELKEVEEILEQALYKGTGLMQKMKQQLKRSYVK